jgi:hypothetical protein
MFSDVFSDHMFYEIIDFIHPIVDFKNGFQNLSFYEIQTLLFFPTFDLDIRLSCVRLSNTFYLQLVRVNGFAICIIPSSRSQVQIVACIVVINDFYCFCSKSKLGLKIAVKIYSRLWKWESLVSFCNRFMEILCWWQIWKKILIKQFKPSLGTYIMKLYVLRLLNHPVEWESLVSFCNR